MNSLIFAYLHHLAAFALVSALVVEFVLIRQELTLGIARALRIADGIYGASAGLIVLVGSLRVIWYEKGVDYYLQSPAFWWKMSLFAIVGVLSIYPTVVFAGWAKSMRTGQLPMLMQPQRLRLQWILSAELIGLVGIPMCAYAMARGIF